MHEKIIKHNKDLYRHFYQNFRLPLQEKVNSQTSFRRVKYYVDRKVSKPIYVITTPISRTIEWQIRR